MAIQKQEFYEGAALHLIARTGQIRSVRYDAPFFFLNDRITVLLKYSTKNRSPWGFTFTEEEQRQLFAKATQHQIVIGLICGSDGIAALSLESYLTIAPIADKEFEKLVWLYDRIAPQLNVPPATSHPRIRPT